MSVDESMRDTTMARTAKHDAIHALVDVKQGLVSRELFVNEELYQQEQEQLERQYQFDRVGPSER